MEHRRETRHGPPLAYRFVGQSGRKIDPSTQSAIRSHAMKEFRSRQRQQRQLEHSAGEKDLSMCRCSPLAQLSSAASEQYSKRQRRDTSSTTLTSASERCYRCGRVQFSRLSPSQEMNVLQQSSSIATFAVADFDPFNSIAELPPSLTSKFSKEINAIKTHAITFFSPGIIKSIVFPVALQMPALWASILYMTYSHLSSVRGWGSIELALGLKVAAISQINLKLSHPSTAACTNVIASIAYLSTGTWVFGTPFEEVEMHLNGMELMVKQRGMGSLSVYQFGRTIRKYLFVQHLLLAAIRAQPTTSTFDFDYSQASNADSMHSTKHESPLYCPQGTFAQLFQSKQLSKNTAYILYNAKALIDLVITLDEGSIEVADFDVSLCHIKRELERHISAYDLQNAPPNGNPVFECCRLTTVIMLKAIETAQPLMSSDPALTLSLVGVLEKTDIGGNWGELSGLLYWVSIVGAASSQGRPGHMLLDSTLGRIMSEIAFTASDFESAIKPVRRFSRLQMALMRRSQIDCASRRSS